MDGVLSTALRKAYDADPESTMTLLRLAIADIPVVDDAGAYADHMAGVVAGRTAVAKRGLGRAYVETMVSGSYPDEEQFSKTARYLADLDTFAAHLAGMDVEEVGKAYESWSSRGTKSNWRGEVKRDARGRFATSATPSGGRDKSFFMAQRQKGGRKIPRMAEKTHFTIDSKGINYKPDTDPSQVDQWVGDYAASVEQGDKLMAQARQMGLDTKEVRPFVELKSGDRKRKLSVDAKTFSDNGWGDEFYLGDTPTEIGLDFSNPADAQRIAAFNALGGVLGPQAAAAQVGNQENWLRLAQTMGAGAGTLRGEREAARRQTRTGAMFERAEALGGALSSVPGAGGVADVLSTIGAAGPEVERALRPAIERTAGRYQGKERKIDEGLANALSPKTMAGINAIMASDELRDRFTASAAAGEGETKARGQRGTGGPSLPEASLIYALQRFGDESPDQARLAVASDVATDYLIEQLPDPRQAELSRLSGQILPSQGVAIDAKGQPRQQSQGLTDDHYLPFTMKGLSALDGGQYVRTRVNGGLTSEDVRTLLSSGARKATVVSRGGVFSLELDPNAQGAGKTAQLSQRMADNYSRILDAVQGSGQYLRDLPAETKMRLEAEVREQNRYVEDPQQLSDLVEARLQKERADQERITYAEMQQLEEQARAEAGPSAGDAEIADLVRAKEDELRKTKTMRLRLNAEGYAAALSTLQAQFPYLIREASYEPLDQFYANRRQSQKAQREAAKIQSTNAEDTGYVGLGETRARTGVDAVGEGRLPAKVRNRREKLAEGQKASAESEAGGEQTPAATGEGGAQAPSAGEGAQQAPGQAEQKAPSAPSSGLDQVVARSSDMLTNALTQANERFNGLQGLMLADPNNANQGATSKDMRVILADPNNGAVLRNIMLSSDSNAVSEAMAADPARTAEAFADRKALATIVSSALSAVEADAMFEAGGPLESLGGKKSVPEVVNWIANNAREVSDLAFVNSGLFAQQNNALESNPSNKAGKPMLFPDIANISTTTQLRSYLDSDEPGAQAAKAGLEQIKATDGAGELRPLTAVGKDVHEKVRAMNAVAQAREQLGSGPADAGVGETLARARMDAGNVSEEAFAEAAGLPGKYAELTNLDAAGAALELNNAKSPEEMNAEAEELQRGLAVFATARTLQLLGGGVDPKVLFPSAGVVLKSLRLPPGARLRLAELEAAEAMWEALQPTG